MTKIRSKNTAWEGRDIILPIVGKVHFNEKCEAEIIDNSIADELVAIEGLDLEKVKVSSPNKPNKPKKGELVAKIVLDGKGDKAELSKLTIAELIVIDETPVSTPEGVEGEGGDEEEEEDKVELSNEEKVNYINSLGKMDELRELAVSFEKKEWETIKSKAKLKEYLISKI